MTSRRVLLAAGAIGLGGMAAPVRAQPLARKPKVPAGRDPGGLAVALIGSGIDYTRAPLAARLARDGEGDLIGWDCIDKDALPFERPPIEGLPAVPEAGTEMAAALLSAAPACRLVPVRVADQSLTEIAEALAFLARTPTPIAVLLARPKAGTPSELLHGLVASAPRLLVVMPVIEPVFISPANAIVVASADAQGRPLADEPADATGIDLAITLPLASNAPGPDPRRSRHLAAVTLGAAAARVLAKERPPDAGALKTHILSAARHVPAPDAVATRAGLIAHPEQLGQP